ncbi:MAG: transcription antiterminator [Microbacteriaceae bacterium]|nr:transcription antiterminator [Microbacteriaceae bacterium]MDQ1578271.1 putative licABCH operon transcriptional regulator [Microbacteriaceae bacterium]
MIDKHERLLDYLAQADDWVTASELADRLGVTTRSVRSYVTAVKSSARPLEVIASSTSGYRLNRELYASFLATARTRGTESETPRDRVYHLVRRLSDAPDGLDIYSLAESLFVSESTIEADLRKIKGIVEESDLTLTRRGALVSIAGSEVNLRRLLSRMFQDGGAQGFLELESIQREFESANLRAFKTDLIGMLDSHGYFVNEYGINNVLLHVAIAVDRTAKEQLPIAEPPVGDGTTGDIPAELASLVIRHFDVPLRASDLDHLALLLTTRVVAPGRAVDESSAVPNAAMDNIIATVRRIVGRVADEYVVDLDNEDFIVRLSLHVQNLIARANDKSYSRNPMTRSIKTAYPMIYELAVFIASEIQRSEGITILDDEISYIALHVGSYLERQSRREERVTCAIVCPNYYDLHLILRERLEAELGNELQIEIVITRTDVDWDELATDLILTTIASRTFADNVVVIQPFLTEGDIEAIRRAISRVRRQRRRVNLKDELLLFFDETLFLRNFYPGDETAMIRALGERMVTAGIIEPAYIDGAIERERMSSTAFTDNIAVPHAMAMTAKRTAICIVVNDTPMAWGENRVSVIALIAFSASGRTTFQTIFDQFVEVFSEREDVQRLIHRSVDFPSFIEELVREIEK